MRNRMLIKLLALASYKLMSDYPERAKFITEEERVYIQERLRLDRSSLAGEFEIFLGRSRRLEDLGSYAYVHWNFYRSLLLLFVRAHDRTRPWIHQ